MPGSAKDTLAQIEKRISEIRTIFAKDIESLENIRLLFQELSRLETEQSVLLAERSAHLTVHIGNTTPSAEFKSHPSQLPHPDLA